MVRDKKLLLQKYDRSAKDGHLYGDRSSQKAIIEEHQRQVIASLEVLKGKNAGKDIKILEVRPIPDIIMIDWEQKKLIAVEVSSSPQSTAKKLNYRNYDAWDRILLVRVKKKQTRRYKFIRRRIYQVSNNE